MIAQGRLYPKPFIDRALARHRQRLEQPLYDRVSTALLRLGTRAVISRDE